MLLTLFCSSVMAEEIVTENITNDVVPVIKIDTSEVIQINAKYAPLALAAMSVFIIDLYIASTHAKSFSVNLMDLNTFLSSLNHWRIIFDILMIFGIFLGIFLGNFLKGKQCIN